MEIFQLEEFKSLTSTLNYSETAYRLSVSTSSLSRHIQQLENELGAPLFDRSSRFITLTEFGAIFLPHAVRILQEYSDGMLTVRNYLEQSKLSFTMGVSYSVSEYSTDAYIKDFQSTYPNCNIRIITGNISDLERGFKDKLFNIYTGLNYTYSDDTLFIQVGTTSIKAVVPPQSDLASRGSVGLSELAEFDLFLPPEKTVYYDHIMDRFNSLSIRPNIVYTGEFEICKGFINIPDAVALFPFRTNKKSRDKSLVYIDIEPAIPFEYGMRYRRGLKPAEALFINHFRELARNKDFSSKLE